MQTLTSKLVLTHKHLRLSLASKTDSLELVSCDTFAEFGIVICL